MKKQHQLLSIFLIGMLSLACWYFFMKKYTYEFEIDTHLNEATLVEILNTTYPATHPDLVLVEAVDDEFFIFQFTNGDVSFFQEIKIHKTTSEERKIKIGVNAQSHFFKERLERFYKETVVQVFNTFLLLQLDKEIAAQEDLLQ